MTTPLPEPPPYVAREAEMLGSFLDYYRAVIMRKVEGLSDDDARGAHPPSTLTLLGIVKHMANVERWWFRVCFDGQDVPLISTDDDPDADFRPEPHESIEDIVALYRHECEQSRDIVKAASLDDIAKRTIRGGQDVSMRWILIHMIEETARHAGHMDLMRERADGARGD